MCFWSASALHAPGAEPLGTKKTPGSMDAIWSAQALLAPEAELLDSKEISRRSRKQDAVGQLCLR
jgi:hypothetical protein